jgi:Bacterial protein of unknown function (DUF916)
MIELSASMRKRLWSSAAARRAAPVIVAGAVVAGLAATASPVLAAQLAPVSGQAPAKSAPRAFFGVGPATAANKIDGRSYFDWSATPGVTLTDHVAVVNFGTTPLTLHVFVTNAVSTVQGGINYVPPAKAIGGPADWVTIHFPKNSSTLRIAPRSKVFLPVTVVIPKNAPPGDHVGAIIVALSSVIQSKNHAKVHFIQQVATKIITRVSGNLRPGLSVDGLKVAYHAPLSPFATSAATLTFTIRNTGNEVLGGNVTVSVAGLLGSTETSAHVIKILPLLPGGSIPERVQVKGVYPEFSMQGNVSVAPLVVQGQVDQGLAIYRGQVGFWAIPWIALAIFALLVLLLAGMWLRRRRWNRTAAAAPEAGAARGDQKVEAK